MAFVTSVTRIKALTTIRRQRRLPVPGEVAVRQGQTVSPVQVVARTSLDTGYQVMRASQVLGIAPGELEKHLLVQEGAALQRGMPLMRGKKNFLGRAKRYASPIDGLLHQVRDGYLILKRTPELVEIRAMMEARVATVMPNRGVILETRGTLIQARWDSSSEGYGKLQVVGSSASDTLPLDVLGTDVRGAILAAGYLDNTEFLGQLEEKGIRGLIVGGMPAELCRAARRLTIPVFITDGIGLKAMAEPIYKLLQGSEGREVALFAHTEGIHGSRSEVVIPLPAGHASEPTGPQPAELAVGQRVRVIRLGQNVQIGEIVTLHHKSRKTDVGTRLPGADVRLTNGLVVFVPYTNMDLIET